MSIKGSWIRPRNNKKYGDEHERIFGKKDKPKEEIPWIKYDKDNNPYPIRLSSNIEITTTNTVVVSGILTGYIVIDDRPYFKIGTDTNVICIEIDYITQYRILNQ